jgi:hypothetical protein
MLLQKGAGKPSRIQSCNGRISQKVLKISKKMRTEIQHGYYKKLQIQIRLLSLSSLVLEVEMMYMIHTSIFQLTMIIISKENILKFRNKFIKNIS